MKIILKKIIFLVTDKILAIHAHVKAGKVKEQLKSAGKNIQVSQSSLLSGLDNISLGNNVVINAFVHIWGEGGVIIGDDCMIASHCAITSLTHDTKSKLFSQENVAGPVRIGNNVWIGAHVIIMPGVTIGDNVVIGAGTLVNKNLPGNTVYIGVPARKLYELDQFKPSPHKPDINHN